jgi:phosphoribosylaminoimidazolecarboxamide formyltransferase/IMP cyclohydrolase
MRTILVSVWDKTGLDKFLKRLERFDNIKLVATRSTSKYLEECGFSCTKVEELTQFPEILSGRVKTLHPKVLGGILSRPSKEDRTCLSEMDIPEIDLVVVNLYPFEKKLQEGLSEPEMVEHIDIGGVTLLRAAAKNFERVAVVCDPDQYDSIIENMDANGGDMTLSMRKSLAYKAFQRTSAYDKQISGYFSRQLAEGESEGDTALPDSIDLGLSQHESLRYGENPHQAAGWYKDNAARFPELKSFPPFEQLQGKEISANNITDVYALVRILRELSQPAVCIIKHNNPCGVALGKGVEEAFEKAYNTDPLSAFGGIYGVTGTVDGALAKRIIEGFVEVVAAPQFDEEALETFKKKKNLRVLRLEPVVLKPAQFGAWRLKDLQELGWIVERDMEQPVRAADFKCVVGKAPDAALQPDLDFAWSVVKHLTSNAIFVARGGCSLGFGLGQTSRIAAMKHALAQAGDQARGAVLASDAFFPATDNIEAAAAAGIKVIIQPGGSVKDADVIAACEKAGITMLFTGQRCFRH